MQRLIYVAIAIALLALPVTASAQAHAHPLFVEALRDPGPAEVVTSSRAAALGGQTMVTGPEAALGAPSALGGMRGTHLVVWGATDGYRRDELRLTPALLSATPGVRLSDRHWALDGGAVMAHARARWAAAAFVDSSAFTHEFVTDEARLSQVFAHGTALWTDGSGRAEAARRQTRFGAAGAVTPAPWLAFGAAAYVVRLRHDVISSLNIVSCSQSAGSPARCDPRASDITSSAIAGTKPAFALSATAGADRPISVTGRWTRAPRFTGLRLGLPVTIDLPDTLALNVRAAGRRTVVLAEIARERRHGTFAADPSAPDHCAAARIPDCRGWGIGEHELRDATAVRAGVEQRVMSGRLALRAGFAVEPHRMLVLGTEAADRTGAVQRWSGGLGAAAGPGEIEMSVARDRHQVLMAAGYRVRLR